MKRHRPESVFSNSSVGTSSMRFPARDPRRASTSSLMSARHHPRFDFEIMPTMPDLDPSKGPPRDPQVGFDFTDPIIPGISDEARIPPGISDDALPQAVDDGQPSFELPWDDFTAFDGPRDAPVDEDGAGLYRTSSSRAAVTEDVSSPTTTRDSTASDSLRASDDRRSGHPAKNPLTAIATKLSRLSSRRRRHEQ